MLKSVLQSRWFTFLAVILIGVFLSLIIRLQPSLETVGKELNNLNQKIAEAEKNNSEMEKLKDYLNNAAYLERQARIKLNYKKPGETAVFVYENPNAQNQPEPDNSAGASTILPNWQKWLESLWDE